MRTKFYRKSEKVWNSYAPGNPPDGDAATDDPAEEELLP
jgi:hypothetical protein